MTRKTSRGLEGETITDAELEVLADALDDFQQAARYAGGLANGADRTEKLRKAGVASRLLERAENEEAKRAAQRNDPDAGA